MKFTPYMIIIQFDPRKISGYINSHQFSNSINEFLNYILTYNKPASISRLI